MHCHNITECNLQFLLSQTYVAITMATMWRSRCVALSWSYPSRYCTTVIWWLCNTHVLSFWLLPVVVRFLNISNKNCTRLTTYINLEFSHLTSNTCIQCEKVFTDPAFRIKPYITSLVVKSQAMNMCIRCLGNIPLLKLIVLKNDTKGSLIYITPYICTINRCRSYHLNGVCN